MYQLPPDEGRVLISAMAIQARVNELADQISSDFSGVGSLYLVGQVRGKLG